MINIMPIFINFLAVSSLKLDNAALEKFCLERKKSSPGRVISNGGGWQSDNLDPAAPRPPCRRRRSSPSLRWPGGAMSFLKENWSSRSYRLYLVLQPHMFFFGAVT